MSVDVSGVLERAASLGADLPSCQVVSGPLEWHLDPGHLLISDPNALNASSDGPLDLDSLARNNAQVLLNRVFSLPIVRVEEVTCAELPAPATPLPREKPIPKPKPLTKWEKFAKEKGIVQKKKTSMMWDDVVKDWIPRFGYKKAVAEQTKNWMMPYKGNAPDDEDPFDKAIESKRERVAKNELQRLRNVARNKNVKIPKVGVTPMVEKQTGKNPNDLKKAAELAKKSTASLGKFQPNLPGSLEKNIKPPKGKKRKFDPLVSDTEKDKNMKILEQITSKAPKLDLKKAVGREMFHQDQDRETSKRQTSGKKGKGRFNKKSGERAKKGKASGRGGKRR